MIRSSATAVGCQWRDSELFMVAVTARTSRQAEWKMISDAPVAVTEYLCFFMCEIFNYAEKMVIYSI